MQQLISVWQGLEARRRVLVVLATVIVFAAVLSLTRIAATPSMSLLYAGLDGSRAGEVVAALDQRVGALEVRGIDGAEHVRQRGAERAGIDEAGDLAELFSRPLQRRDRLRF